MIRHYDWVSNIKNNLKMHETVQKEQYTEVVLNRIFVAYGVVVYIQWYIQGISKV